MSKSLENWEGNRKNLPCRLLSMFFCLALLLCVFNPLTEPSSLINVPLNPDISDFNTETYAFVHRILNKRLLPGLTRGSLPLTRGQIASLLSELAQKYTDGEVILSPVDQQRLYALMQLYADEVSATQISSGQRRHIMQLKGDDYHFAFDLAMAQRVISRNSEAFPREGTMYMTALLPHFHGRIRDDFAWSMEVGDYFLYGATFKDVFPDERSARIEEEDLTVRNPINAYLKFKLPWFELQMGQDNLRWGPGYHGMLLVSENPISMDMIKLQASYEHIMFSAFTAILEDASREIDAKYLSGHRVEGYFWNRLGVGLSEVVVYGNRFEPGFLNPVTIYLINESIISRGDSRSPGSGDNLFMSVDARLRATDGLEIYGEFMLDDGNPTLGFHHWDTKFGILGGIYVTDPFGISDTDLHAEYAFINQYAYTHVNPVNVYKHFSSVIGHHIGSDADDLWVELRHRFTDKLEGVLAYELERHGEGNVNRSHPLDAPRDDRWTPLSGITQSEHRLTLGVNHTRIGRYSFAGDFAQVWMRNMGNQAGLNESGQEIRLKALYRF